jgi:hypothetical protein
MAELLQHLNTLSSVVASTYINTGNRMLDNSLVAIVSVLSVKFITEILGNWKRYWNMAVYVLYDMKKNPFDWANIPYKYDTKLPYSSAADFIQNNSDYESLTSHLLIASASDYYCDKMIKLLNGRIVDIMTKNKAPRIQGKDGRTLTQLDKNGITEYVYPFVITSNGTMIYCVMTRQHDLDLRIISPNIFAYIQLIEMIRIHLIPGCVEEWKGAAQCNEKSILQPSVSSGGIALVKVGKVSPKKTFDSLFYPQKAALIHLLEKFKAQALYPAHMPMDNKLGILLYGPPGTGKTGTITAIANILEKSIIVVNFIQITKCKQLDDIMKPELFKDHLFVFDEFDCILDALGKGMGGGGSDKSDWGSMLMAAEGDERKEILKMMREGKTYSAESQIDMAYLLQKLDGLVSAEDRVIVATTNNPDKINPALLRPGRFDLKLCLGNCVGSMAADILEHYYGAGTVREAVLKAGLPDGALSPLELMNRAMQAPSVEDLLADLKAISGGPPPPAACSR